MNVEMQIHVISCGEVGGTVNIVKLGSATQQLVTPLPPTADAAHQ